MRLVITKYTEGSRVIRREATPVQYLCWKGVTSLVSIRLLFVYFRDGVPDGGRTAETCSMINLKSRCFFYDATCGFMFLFVNHLILMM